MLAEAQPWWAAPTIGVGGAIVGAAIAFTATWIATTRQLHRQERETRREVYVRYLDAAFTLANALRSVGRGREEHSSLRDAARQAMFADEDDIILRVTPRIESARDQLSEQHDDLESAMDTEHLRYYEVLLCAGKPIRDQVRRTRRVLDALAAATRNHDSTADEHTAAYRAAVRAIQDFGAIAQSDLRTPGALRVRAMDRVLRRDYANDDGSS